jgi:choline kinase
MGSRYGKLKQMDPMGPSNEVLLDYSVFDALRAGFGKIVFIIRHDFEEDFKAQVSARFSKQIPVDFAYQELNKLPAGVSVPPGREKPWGTAHAILCARDVVKEPFCVINADDFYGQATYVKIAEHLRSIPRDSSDFAMVGFRLDNTLSENGSVTRGVCQSDGAGFLTDIEEMKKIRREAGGIFNREDAAPAVALTGAEPVSMNIWGFTPKLFEHLDRIFREFIKQSGTELKSECYIPVAVGQLVKEKLATCKVLRTDSEWFGITYPEDKPTTKANLLRLVQAGKYPENLWG